MKKIISFLLIMAMVFTLAACRTKAPNDDKDNGDKNNQENNTVVDPTPEGDTVNIKLYFANREYILTGDENVDAIIAIERKVKLGEKPIEEVVLDELKNKPDDENLSTIVEKIKVLSVETAENTAYVNLSSENLHGGSLEESLILQQIVLSLTELEGVNQVQFLVDGSKRETLMGHVLIEEPLNRDEMQ